MIDLNDLTIEDLKDIEKLQEFRKKAENLYTIVVREQTVPLVLDEQNRYRLWYDGNNANYLKYINGGWVWQARYLHQSYDVPINAEKIYKMMVRAYEYDKDKNNKGTRNSNKEAIEYFSSYVDRLKEKNAE